MTVSKLTFVKNVELPGNFYFNKKHIQKIYQGNYKKIWDV